MTKDLALLVGADQKWLSTMGFLDKVDQNLKAAMAVGVADAKKDGAATVAKMKSMPTEDDCFGAGSIRADGRCIHPSFLYQVKTPAESKYPWDYYKLLATTPADQAFRPLADGKCSLAT